MEVEDVARISLASRRTTQQQGHLSVGPGLLGKVVVDDQGVLAVVHEGLGHGATGIGGDVLQGSGIVGGSHHHDGVVHGAVLFQSLDDAGHRGSLLAHRHVDADDILALLVEDGVEGDRRLARSPVPDDQLALAAPDGGHGVDGHQAGLKGLFDSLAVDDAGSREFDRTVFFGLERALAVDGLADGVDHPAQQPLANGHLRDSAGALDLHAFLDLGEVAQNDGPDVVFLQVEGHPEDALPEIEQLAEHGLFEPVDTGDAVADLEHRPHMGDAELGLVMLDLFLDDGADLVGPNAYHNFPPSERMRLKRKASSLPARVSSRT